jgi:uncharacterized membrane protein (UPF0127 family)
MRVALPAVLLLAACTGGAQEKSKPAPASAAPATHGWTPAMDGCGPLDRCVDAKCAQPPAMTGVAAQSTGRVTFETPMGERSYQVEVVQQPFETMRGLMCRTSMKPDWGMLFLLEARQIQHFWMKNTLIPLDMVFIDEDWQVAGVVADAAPRTTSSRAVDAPSRYVLELNAGEAARAGIAAGVKARFYPPRR